MLPFGLSTVVIAIWLRTSSSDRPLATSFAGSTWIRIDGFCWPPIKTCATPEIWLICCASWASTASLTLVRGRVSDVADNIRIGESAGLTLRQVGGNLDGREIHLRQRRHRQQRVGDEADKENAGHQQRSADGITNEGCGNAFVHSCLTLDCAGSELATAVVTSVPG